MMRKKGYISKIYMAIVFLFMYAPIILLMIFSFNDSKSRSVWNGFSLRWYEKLLRDSTILEAIKVTLTVSICAAVISTILGTAAALGIFSMKKTPRRIMNSLNNIPMMNPDIIMGVSLMLQMCIRDSLKALPPYCGAIHHEATKHAR